MNARVIAAALGIIAVSAIGGQPAQASTATTNAATAAPATTTAVPTTTPQVTTVRGVTTTSTPTTAAPVTLPTTTTTTGPVVLGAGSEIGVSPAGQYGRCMLTAVGTDSAGNHLGLTAGHCASLGSVVKTADLKTPVGTVVSRSTFSGSGAFTYNVLDYAFIKFSNNVVFGNTTGAPMSPRKIATPAVGQLTCKFGDGYQVPLITCGVVTKVTAVEFYVGLQAFFGDSGATVYPQAGTAVLDGVLSRPSGIPLLSSVIMTRADAAIADAKSHGWTGGSFTPLG